MRKASLAWTFYLPSIGVFLYFLMAVLMLTVSSEGAIILGKKVPAQELLMIELPPLVFGFLSLVFIKERARFFALFSLGASLMMFASQRPDISWSQYVAFLPFFGVGTLNLREKQPLSFNERLINLLIALVAFVALLHFRDPLREALGISCWIPLLLFVLGVGLLITKNRVLSAAGLPLIAGFFGVLLYVCYPFYGYYLGASLVLAFYTVIPLKKLMR
ncbi:hypothetical protein [Thermococcus sp.]|uniref:hypothetical protein n=1 Tax=Thermococcus sp. TaxID=35749 RepID=UPI0025F16AAA|nr:hypothetical protein [Thermococcus sp.]